MNHMDVVKRIDTIIVNSSNEAINEQLLNDDTDLVSDLMFDSISIISLVIELEKEFDFEFCDDYLRLEYLRPYSWIVEFNEKEVIGCETREQTD